MEHYFSQGMNALKSTHPAQAEQGVGSDCKSIILLMSTQLLSILHFT
uniref:Uncharacterized protein n=1 Tax=Anguilla anguilla TaxID=7936 RepID=A0A0E9WJ49_ANGAN